MGHVLRSVVVIVCSCLLSPGAIAQDSRTVIGPSNLDLHDGAEALMAGDAKEGVRLTLLGLQQTGSRRDRITAWSNLCAGYALLGELEAALEFCDRVLEVNDRHWRAYNNRALVYVKMQRYEAAEQDLQKGEAIAPNSRTLKAVRAMLLDAVEPVAPNIVIDDRRQPAVDKNDQ